MIIDKKPVSFVDSCSHRRDQSRIKFSNSYKIKLYCLKYIPIFLFFVFQGFLSALLFSFIWWLFTTVFFDHRLIANFSPVIRVWFGVPGSGKTSVGAWLSSYSLRQGYRVLSNVHIKGTYKLDTSDLGTYDMSFDGDGCHVIFDEATISGIDSRDFSHFNKTNLPRYFNMHRHMNNMVDVFSQGYDIDKRIRDRASSSGLFHLKKFPVKGFVFYRQIKKILFIKKDDKQMIDGFEYKGLPRILYVRSVWDSFDTLDMSLCPKSVKEWSQW